ncbi:hypothetical protein [Halorubrum sp. DTA98]|uniref:hypothetical protein n=1 Tax=Halorubrum sp. DTA98 TaxID=3402163 RepID=UPI003AAF16A4
MRHGFGFRNWNSRHRPFEPSEDETDPSSAAIRDRIATEWRGPASDLLDVDLGGESSGLLDVITTQLRSAILQRAGTNGHCYGMALAAQAYFESPETLPLDRESAAAIRHPTEPLSEPDAPVYHEITRLQAEQFLRFRTWLGRRAILWPDRIDLETQLDDVRAVIDVFGSAQVSVFDSRTSGHQMLAYDYEEHRDGISVYVYDPNHSASTYGHRPRVLEFEATTDGIEMVPYGNYEWLLFNRYDRIEEATGRATATPLDHVDISPARFRDEIFPTALVTVDTPDVELTISDPNGGRLGRLRSDFMDRSRGPVARVRSAYGVDAGEYRIDLHGRRSTPYELRVHIAGPNGTRLSVAHADRIGNSETKTFIATVPETADETGTFEPFDRRFGRLPIAAASAGGGVAAGAGLHYLWHRRRRRE